MDTIKKIVEIVVVILFVSTANAQTGIGTTTPHASAKLDVSATNKGFLPPRVTLTSNTDATTIPSPAEGLLVYNLGSSGLQAGYYYWNNANWATIATATSAGNGVTASDMVKIYDGIGNAPTINTSGVTFSVTSSGKYLFDFSTSATCGNCIVTLNFQVRDGSNSNTVIGSDMQTSYSNNVHAEYNGKVEANLLAGRSYNVLVTASSGNIYNNDYTRVYMKQVAGNLPVTGQSVDYIQASLSANQALSAAGNIIFNTSSGAGITITSGGFNLIANKTYKLEAALGGASGGYAYYGWVDNTNTLLSGGSIGAVMKAGTAYTDAPQDKAVVYFTPIVDTRVFLRVYSLSGTLTAYAPSTSGNYSSTWANISQVGSSAFVNPWILSGTNTFNTTGNVGIGNNAPTAKLDVMGSFGVSGSATFRTTGGDEGGEIEFGVPQTNTTLSTRVVADVWQNRFRIFDGNTKGVYIDLSKAPTGVGGELLTKASGFVNAGDYVTLGNIRARIPTSGNRSLQVATVSGTYSVYGSGVHVFSSNVGSTTIDGGSPRTITTTPVYLNPGNTFATAGGTDTWNIMDTTNFIAWRISCIIGGGYFANLITIERLF
ncbi:hypothetical protein [Flavobacterium sp.]|jgi:hypothetical protein|uniref:hypothetical protein n=1 Tax=Flavobacterium sp. TaxID=239 RepID=UPI0037C1AF49